MAERDPLGYFRREVVVLIEEAFHAVYGQEVDAENLLETPDPEIADLALPCFQLASELSTSPADIAVQLEEAMPQIDALDVDAQGPYLNFRIHPDDLADKVLDSIRDHAAGYGHGKATGQRVLVEHTSANPTGPLHVGRARNPLLSDTLVRVLRAAGHDVTAEYYVNDMGRQAATLVWGVENCPDGVDEDAGKEDRRLVGCYQAANERLDEEPDLDEEVRGLIKRFEAGEDETATLFRETVRRTLEGIRQTLARAGVQHDNFKFESELVLGGQVDKVVERLEALDETGLEDGALYLDMEALGVETEKPKMFLRRADGTTLYGTRDIAYHLDKAQRADSLVDVLGEDHKLHALELQSALVALDEEVPLDVVFYNFVSLPEGSMSTRAGRVVYFDDLLDEAEARAYQEVEERRGDELSEETMREVARQVGIGALRFNIVGVQSEKPITFRWEDALAFEGATAPFVQYAHARTHGILEKGGVEPGQVPEADPSVLTHDSEQALIRTLGKLPGLVQEMARQRKVHPLTAYAVEVAGELNQFYRDCPVLKAEDEATKQARLALVDATRQVLANTLEMLGIEAPASM